MISGHTQCGTQVFWQVSPTYSEVVKFLRFEHAYGKTTAKVQDTTGVMYTAGVRDLKFWFGENPHDLGDIS